MMMMMMILIYDKTLASINEVTLCL